MKLVIDSKSGELSFADALMSSRLIPLCAGFMSVGAALGASSTALWWGVGDGFVAIGLVLFAFVLVGLMRLRGGADGETGRPFNVRHIATAFALSVPLVVGVFLLGTDPAIASGGVVPLLFWAAYAIRRDLGVSARVVSFGAAAVVAVVTVVASPSLQTGFAALVQGTVVALVALVLVVGVLALIGRSVQPKP